MLGGHSDVTSLGEAVRLYWGVRYSAEGDLCTCGRAVLDCPFWQQVEAEAQRDFPDSDYPALANMITADRRMEVYRTPKGFRDRMPHETDDGRSRLNELALVVGSRRLWQSLGGLSAAVATHRRIGADLNHLYELVRRAHGTPVVVDSTKNAGYLKAVYLQRTAPIHFIVVLRDGRAVCYSRIRRLGVSMEVAARMWRKEHQKRRTAQFTIRDATFHTLRYEDLCREPEAEIRKVCLSSGIEFQPSMLDFRSERHNLGGNPMRFRDSETEIRLDERWKDESTAPDLRVFDRVAGRLNRRLGYPSAGDS